MSLHIDLDGSVALVTGAARGIGFAIAEVLVAAGAQVVIADIDRETAETAAAALGPNACAVTVDVADLSSAEEAVATASRVFGPVEILVNNAFATETGPFLKVSTHGLRLTVDVILMGAIHMSRAALPTMVAARRGRIINIISEAGRVGEPGMAVYSAAKAGVIGLTKATAKEFGRHGITANGVSPGGTRTQTTLDQMAADNVEEARLARLYPLGRLGEPADIAGAVLWLASPYAAWVTGQIVAVNGGYATA